MTRHVLDTREQTTADRMPSYTRIERDRGAEGPHTTTQALQRRQPDSLAADTRPVAYARIERGRPT